MKFAFFGTPYVARDTLAALLDKNIRPEVVVTNPDVPRGRGHVISPSETKILAMEHDIPVLTPSRLDNETVEAIVSYGCEYAIVVAYGKILPKDLIDSFPKGVFNIHYSLLPKYRGATPVESALLNDEKTTGVTIQKMAVALDSGDILYQREIEILPEDTTVTLRQRLIEIGSELLVEAIFAIEGGSIKLVPQDHSQATYAPKLKKEDGLISLEAPALENWNKYRAYKEWPGIYFFEDGKRIKITAAHLDTDGNFIIDRVIPEGKKEMDYK